MYAVAFMSNNQYHGHFSYYLWSSMHEGMTIVLL